MQPRDHLKTDFQTCLLCSLRSDCKTEEERAGKRISQQHLENVSGFFFACGSQMTEVAIASVSSSRYRDKREPWRSLKFTRAAPTFFLLMFIREMLKLVYASENVLMYNSVLIVLCLCSCCCCWCCCCWEIFSKMLPLWVRIDSLIKGAIYAVCF